MANTTYNCFVCGRGFATYEESRLCSERSLPPEIRKDARMSPGYRNARSAGKAGAKVEEVAAFLLSSKVCATKGAAESLAHHLCTEPAAPSKAPEKKAAPAKAPAKKAAKAPAKKEKKTVDPGPPAEAKKAGPEAPEVPPLPSFTEGDAVVQAADEDEALRAGRRGLVLTSADGTKEFIPLHS